MFQALHLWLGARRVGMWRGFLVAVSERLLSVGVAAWRWRAIAWSDSSCCRGAYVRAASQGGYTALMLTVLYGSSEVVRELLDCGADLEAKDCVSSQAGHERQVRLSALPSLGIPGVWSRIVANQTLRVSAARQTSRDGCWPRERFAAAFAGPRPRAGGEVGLLVWTHATSSKLAQAAGDNATVKAAIVCSPPTQFTLAEVKPTTGCPLLAVGW